MSSVSNLVDKALRRSVSPVLREAGFDIVRARRAWAWKADCIWVYIVRAVGSYFSDVTGWPPASLCVELGVHYPFMPPTSEIRRNRKSDRLMPAEYQCDLRLPLERRLAQVEVARLRNEADRKRRDLWWVGLDGAHAEAVAADIGAVVASDGVNWLLRASDLQEALRIVLAEVDCYSKHARAAWLAKRLGHGEEAQVLGSLAAAEANRVGIADSRYLTDVPFGPVG